MVQFHALGGAIDPKGQLPSIGGSAYLLRCGEVGVLFDFGVYPFHRFGSWPEKKEEPVEKKEGEMIRPANLPVEGTEEFLSMSRQEQLPRYSPLLAVKRLYVVLTHAHDDHNGALPYLVRRFPQAVVFMTKETLYVSLLQWRDTLERAEQKGNRCLFTEADIAHLQDRITLVGAHHDKQELESGLLSLEFFPPGHALGGLSCLVTVQEEERAPLRIFMTGDMTRTAQKTIPAAELPDLSEVGEIHYAVVETTNGHRVSPPRSDLEMQIVSDVEDCMQTGGKFLFGVRAVGQAQELMAIFRTYGITERYPVFLDGMAAEVARAYATFQGGIMHDVERHCIATMDERKAFIASPGPGVMLAAHHLFIGGWSLWYLKHLAPDNLSRVSVSSAGFPGSLGHQLQRASYGDTIQMDGEPVTLRASIVKHLLPSHMDQMEIVETISDLAPSKGVFLVHGEPEAMRAVTLRSRIRTTATILGEVYDL